eukprot:1152495-Pelagomonas_calceolata.AAC.1
MTWPALHLGTIFQVFQEVHKIRTICSSPGPSRPKFSRLMPVTLDKIFTTGQKYQQAEYGPACTPSGPSIQLFVPAKAQKAAAAAETNKLCVFRLKRTQYWTHRSLDQMLHGASLASTVSGKC